MNVGISFSRRVLGASRRGGAVRRCREAFGVVSALHPAGVFRSRRPDGPAVADRRVREEIDVLDARSLLGDVGDRRGRSGLDI